MKLAVGREALLKHLIKVFKHSFLLFQVIPSFQVQEKRLNSKVKSAKHLGIYCWKKIWVRWCAHVDVCARMCMPGLNVQIQYIHNRRTVHARVHLCIARVGLCMQVNAFVFKCVRSHSCGLDFVPRGAHPSRVVRQSLTLFSLQTWFHLTPPFPNYNGRWGRWAHIRNTAG